jgi:lipopolysaccharide/colanic/teichoic acid biosynthesis glycosyltransferase
VKRPVREKGMADSATEQTTPRARLDGSPVAGETSARVDASTFGRAAKRFLDIVVSFAMLVCVSLPLLAIAIAIKLDSPGPVFYAHPRIGRYGKEIRVLKFRTMVPDADRKLRESLEMHPDLRAAWDASFKIPDDPRITGIGRILRRFSLDELPQLVNIVRGEMSLVGPRPVVPEELDRFGNKTATILRALPGLTGLWAVSGRSDVTYDERVALEYRYVTNWTFGLDVSILLRTIPVVLRGHGTY